MTVYCSLVLPQNFTVRHAAVHTITVHGAVTAPAAVNAGSMV